MGSDLLIQEDVQRETVLMKLDDASVLPEYKEGIIKYIPEQELSEGFHNVKIFLRTNKVMPLISPGGLELTLQNL